MVFIGFVSHLFSGKPASVGSYSLRRLGRRASQKLQTLHLSQCAATRLGPRMGNEEGLENTEVSRRLFSNIDEQNGFIRKQGSELGCAVLISGTTIGAGVLALPASTAGAGFLSSSLTLLLIWLYMLFSGLLIAEVNVQTSCALGRPSGVSLLGMADAIFGVGLVRILVGLVYGGLHYAILTAYVAQGGAVFRDAIGSEMLENGPIWISQLLFGGGLGMLLYFGNEKLVEGINNVLVTAAVMTFLALTLIAGQHLDIPGLLARNNLAEIPKAIPVMLVSMVYHNVVGTISARLEGDFIKIHRVIAGGTLVPLVMFLVWNAVILSFANQLKAPVGSVDPLEVLRTQGGSTSDLINAFSLLAIATSFIGFIYGLVDYINDARITVFNEQPSSVSRSEWLSFFFAVLPPILVAGTKPDVFYSALDAAGLFFISTLFGALPALMAWKKTVY